LWNESLRSQTTSRLRLPTGRESAMKATRCPICENVLAIEKTLNSIVPEGEIMRRRNEMGLKAERMAK
jgi:hypothetical protein